MDKICSKIWHYDSNYKAGVYSISPSMTCSDIAKVIVSGKETTNSFTVPEGSTIETVAETLAKDGLVDKKKFLEAAQNSDAYSDFGFLKDAQKGKNHLEGYLFPSTYQVAPKADYYNYAESVRYCFYRRIQSQGEKAGVYRESDYYYRFHH